MVKPTIAWDAPECEWTTPVFGKVLANIHDCPGVANLYTVVTFCNQMHVTNVSPSLIHVYTVLCSSGVVGDAALRLLP